VISFHHAGIPTILPYASSFPGACGITGTERRIEDPRRPEVGTFRLSHLLRLDVAGQILYRLQPEYLPKAPPYALGSDRDVFFSPNSIDDGLASKPDIARFLGNML